MKDNPFLETMQSHSDRKLKDIVENFRSDYQPDALSAAEYVLRQRKVKFTEAEPDEIVEMSDEEIRDDIQQRRAKGESMSSIREYYRSCGVDIDDVDGTISESSKKAAKRIKMRVGLTLLGAFVAAMVHFNDKGKSGGSTIVLIVIGAIAVVWLAATSGKPKR